MAIERRLRAAGYRLIAGVDEVGRGPIAGPVVAAAVVMPEHPRVAHVTDSKALTPKQREEIAAQIEDRAVAWGIGLVSAAVIDCTDILRATHVAMRSALAELSPEPDYIVVDGRPVPELPAPSEAVVGGDRVCYCVAAASILAKVYRDRVMAHMGRLYPGYGLEGHKGYASPQHQEAIAALGPSPVHRMSFEPLKSLGQRSLDL